MQGSCTAPLSVHQKGLLANRLAGMWTNNTKITIYCVYFENVNIIRDKWVKRQYDIVVLNRVLECIEVVS